jgi:hypothetical protein
VDRVPGAFPDMSELQPLRRTIRGGRAFFFSDPAIDKVLSMVVTLAGEVWALRERLSAMEAIGVRQGSLSASEVDDYEFTPEQDERLGAQRKEFIESLFRVIEEQVEAAVAKSPEAAAQARRRPGMFGARISSLEPGKARKRSAPTRAATKPRTPKPKRGRTGATRPAAARRGPRRPRR